MAWLGDNSEPFRRWFDATFKPEWMHILAHLVLYAVLVILLVTVFGLPLDRRAALKMIVLVLVVGISQELLQALDKGEFYLMGVVFDLGIDIAGGALGFYGLAFTKSIA